VVGGGRTGQVFHFRISVGYWGPGLRVGGGDLSKIGGGRGNTGKGLCGGGVSASLGWLGEERGRSREAQTGAKCSSQTWLSGGRRGVENNR